MRRIVYALSLVVLATFLMTACAGNTVRLLYSPAAPGVLPASSSKRVTVVMFEDKRNNQSIGVRRNGTPFAASSSVVDWVSRSMGDALLKQGVQVAYATTMAEAKRAKSDYIVSGVVTEVWLQEPGAASVLATLRLSVDMSGAKGSVYSENVSATQDRKVITSGDVETLLVDTLRELTAPAARKMAEQLR